MTVCPRCGETALPRLVGHRCPAVWSSCRLCGNRFRLTRAMATALREIGINECSACSPSLHRSLADPGA